MPYQLTPTGTAAVEEANEDWQRMEHDERAMVLCQYSTGRDLLWMVFVEMTPEVLEEVRAGVVRAVRAGGEPSDYFDSLNTRTQN